MSIPELNDDILGLILDLLGDQVTCISPILRDKYFRKNGIWISCRDIIGNHIEHFPEKFYEYPLNFNLEKIQREELRICLSQIPPKMKNYIINSTVFAKKCNIADARYFPNLKRVEKSDNIGDEFRIKILEETAIRGVNLRFNFPENITEFNARLKNIDCTISLCCYTGNSPLYNGDLINKLSSCCIQSIYPGKFYPNLESLFFEGPTSMEKFEQKYFPKLKTAKNIWLGRLEELRKYFPNIKRIELYRYNEIYVEEYYKKIVEYGYKMLIPVNCLDESLSILVDLGKKYGSGNIMVEVLILTDYIVSAKMRSILKIFKTRINIDDLSPSYIEKFLDSIFSLPDIHECKQIRIRPFNKVPLKYHRMSRDLYRK